MKLKLLFIIILFFIWNKQRTVNTDNSNWQPDMFYAELEAKALGASMTFVNDLPIKNVVESVVASTEEEIMDETILIDDKFDENGRWPRIICLTNLKTCSPCVELESTMSLFDKDKYQKLGWTKGRENTNMIEIVDINKDMDKFNIYADKLHKFNEKLILGTPTLIKINNSGEICGYVSGARTFREIVAFATKEEK